MTLPEPLREEGRDYTCGKCGGHEFKVRRGGPSGQFRICQPCTIKRRRAYYQENREHMLERKRLTRQPPPEKFKEYRRNWALRNRYGLTPEQYAAMVAQQHGRCLICGKVPPASKPLHVDHCHETGVIRGLLCFRCNPGLAHFDDNPERLKAAAEYCLAALRALAQGEG